MSEIFKPNTTEQLIDVIQWANAHESALAVQGSGSKIGIGRPVDAEGILDLSGFSGVSQYEPNELVLTAGAGTPLADIEKLLTEHRQMLAFEPPDYSGIFHDHLSEKQRSFTENGGTLSEKQNSLPKKRGTLGGVLAGNISGPRRFYAGAARDHFLGFRAVSGRGEPFKSGGRVVKNVTGFDLSKLMAGSWGTLAACWEVTVKVLPMPEKTRTLLLFGLSDEDASRCIGSAAATPNSISGASYLPASLSTRPARSSISSVFANNPQSSVIALRVEGPEPSVEHRINALRELLTNSNDYARPNHVGVLHSADSRVFWNEVGNLHFLSSGFQASNAQQKECWRLSVPPAVGWQVARNITEKVFQNNPEVSWFSDQAGGLIWLSCPVNTQAGVPAKNSEHAIRSAMEPWGGHATLWQVTGGDNAADHRRNTQVFQPQPEALAALSQRVKRSFDPNGVLNPGRMYAGL
ncbi:MAG: FAD-binding protein [Porticoccaceae bacterium]